MSRLLPGSGIIHVINPAQRQRRGWWRGSAEGRGRRCGRLTEVLRQQASFSRAVMSSDRAEWRSAAWPEGASHTVKTFSFTRDSCHFLSAEVPSMQPPSLRPLPDSTTYEPARCHTAYLENKLINKKIQTQGRCSFQKCPIHHLSRMEGLEEGKEGEEAALIAG